MSPILRRHVRANSICASRLLSSSDYWRTRPWKWIGFLASQVTVYWSHLSQRGVHYRNIRNAEQRMESLEGANALAKQMLSRLSYTPTREASLILEHFPPLRNRFHSQPRAVTGASLFCGRIARTCFKQRHFARLSAPAKDPID